MKILPVSNFAKAGLNSDLIPWDLPADFVTEIKNVRIRNGALWPFGGYGVLAELPIDHISGYLLPAGSQSGSFWLSCGLDEVYAFDGALFHNISEASGYASVISSDVWSGCMLSNIAILNNANWYPQYWPRQSSGVNLLMLPWDESSTWEDNSESCSIMRSHKQFLFALGINSGVQELPSSVRWSAPADVGGIPPTWNHLDTTNVAGLVDLGGDGGLIIDGLSLRDAFVVYRKRGVTVFDYVGGQYVWQIRHLSTGSGLIAPDCIIEVEGVHYFISDGDILSNDGNAITSLLHDRIRNRFTADYDSDNYLNSFVVRNTSASEAWFCIPSAGQEHPNIAYIYNWRDDTWSIRDLPSVPFANYGSIDSAPLTWDSISSYWDDTPTAWSRRQLTPFNDSIIGVSLPEGEGGSGQLLALDADLGSNENNYQMNIERTGFALEGLNQVTTITRVYPHIFGSGTVMIQVGSQDHPGANTRWKQPVPFEINVDRKVDIRTTGELHCFRFFVDSVGSSFKISGMDICYVLAGGR